jgi:hypothetical protein
MSKATIASDEQANIELPDDRPNPQKVTLRAFMIGLVLALLIDSVVPYNDYYVGATFLAGNWFPIGGVAALLLLILIVNPLLIALNKRSKCFTPGEIMCVWGMIVVVSGVPSSGLMRYLIPHIVAPYYFATPSNGWQKLIISHMPYRLLVTDPAAVKPFFEGLKAGQPIPWGAWVRPLFYWSMFVAMLYGIFFCMAAMLRRQWVETERYTFPLVKLPTIMAQAPEPGHKLNSYLRDPILWSAVILVTCLHTVKGLHIFYPTIPDIPTTFNSSKWITSPPYNAVNDIVFNFYPLVVGFTYLISSDVCLSLWLFYVVLKLQILYGAMHSFDTTGAGAGISMGAPAYVVYQEAGGAIALAAWLLWSMRGHLKDIWLKATSSKSNIDDSGEPMPYRLAFFGFVGCYIGFFLWLTLIAALPPVFAGGLVLISFVIFMMLSWMVAQAGVLFMQQSFSAVQISAALVGKAFTISPASLATASIVENISWFDARELMLPSILNVQKAATETSLSQRSLTKALAVCVVCAVVVSAVASISLPYTHGGATSLKDTWSYSSAPQMPFWWASNQATGGGATETAVQKSILTNAAAGGLLVAALFVLRTLFVGFPLSPAGFLIAATYPMYALWFSFSIGWAIKMPILRYGGLQGYRRLMPFFLGLILGDCMNAIVWTIVGLFTHVGYSLLPT